MCVIGNGPFPGPPSEASRVHFIFALLEYSYSGQLVPKSANLICLLTSHVAIYNAEKVGRNGCNMEESLWVGGLGALCAAGRFLSYRNKIAS